MAFEAIRAKTFLFLNLLRCTVNTHDWILPLQTGREDTEFKISRINPPFEMFVVANLSLVFKEI